MPGQAPGRIRLTVWLLTAFFALAIGAAALSLVWNARQTALASSEAQISRFVAGAESAFNRSLLAVDVLLAGTDDLLGLANTAPEWIDGMAASQMLRRATRQNLTVRFVALMDERGLVVASSDIAGPQLVINLPTGFFEQALLQQVSTLVVSAPVVSFGSGERVMYFARHVRLGDGSKFLVVAQVPESGIVSLLMQGVDIAGLQVTLERSRGDLLVGIPSRNAQPARGLQPTLAELGKKAGIVQAAARLSAAPALVLARPTLYQDLWISASLPTDAALAGWRKERNAVVGTAIVFVLMVLLAGGVAVAYLNRITAARMVVAQSKATLDEALASMVSGFLLLDKNQQVVQWNLRFLALFPWMQDLLRPQVPFRQVLQAKAAHHMPDATEQERARWVERRLAGDLTDGAPHEQLLPGGQYIQITERPTPDGGRVITYHDVTDLRRASAEIETLAFFDPLTGLPNRRLLLDRLSQATVSANRSGQVGALLFLDLDKFKIINDTLGHEVGDQLLQQVAQRLKACVRDADTVARLGGDEFVVMLKNLSPQDHHAAALAQHIGEKILHSLDQPYRLGAHTHRTSCSLGATLFGASGESAADLLKQADIAMYQVKANHGNALCFFDPTMQTAISHRAQMEADLRVALAEQQFELHYQPQFSLAGHLVGAEVLLRWRHPQRGMVSPAEFIAVAEERELIIPMGQWVLRTACQQLAQWQPDPRFAALRLSVNVSARQFHQHDFVDAVIDVLRDTGVKPGQLTLELTESLVLDNVDDCIAKMTRLKSLGVGFSVDDFGTGYSSLAYLTRLPLDELKIDQSFVRNLGVRQTDGVIVQTIIGMARNLGLEVIAEGVETQAQKDLLAAHGCELYQGYLFARPAPAAALETLVLGQLDANLPKEV